MNTKKFIIISCGLIALIVKPALSSPINFITNGNFESGNMQFGSDYTYSPIFNNDADQYTIRNNSIPWNGNFISAQDHTSGTGNFFIGNGGTTNQRVWFSSQINIASNTNYFFEAYATNVCCNLNFGHGTTPVNPAELSFYANGDFLGTRSVNTLGTWEGLSATWNSGSFTSVTLEIRNSNLLVQGNDFAIDDIFLGTQSSIATVPEPSSLNLLMSGLAGLPITIRRMKK